MRYSKLNLLLLQIGIIFFVFILLFVSGYMISLSFEMAEAFPEIAHMQLPVLAMVLFACVVLGGMLVTGTLILQAIKRQEVFTLINTRRLQFISILSFINAIDFIVLMIYTEVNVKSSITNIYALIAMIAFCLLGLLFQLFAALFSTAQELNEEVEQTI